MRPGANVSAYGYDFRGLLTRFADPLTKVMGYEYDASGNLTREAPPVSGTDTTYVYDAADQLTRVNRPTGDYRRQLLHGGHHNGMPRLGAHDATQEEG